MPKEPPEEQYATCSELKERGWSRTMIRDFLDPPDATRRGKLRSYVTYHQYLLDRVRRAEATPEWQEARKKSQKRSATASDAAIKSMAARAATKEAEETRMLQRAAEVDLRLNRNVSLAELRELATDARRDDSPEPFSDRAERRHQERLMVNYIRHELSSYDLELTRLGDGPGHQEARVLLHERLIKEIAEVWPELEEAAIIAAQRAEVRPVHRAPSIGSPWRYW